MSTATLRPPEAAGIGRGLALALLAHGLLILALSWGLHWHSDNSPAFEAELWSSVPQVAAPREQLPPEPEPEAPRPDTKARHRAAEEAAQEQREAEIAIAKAKKLKEDKAREDAARLEREKEAQDRLAKEKAAKEEQDRKKEKADKAAKDAKEAKEAKEADARREALRQQQLRRIQGLAGATGAQASTGTALQNAAPSASWIGLIRQRISQNTTFDAEGTANPEVEIRVFVTPDGQILGMKVIRPSPDPKWDEAALRGIEKTRVIPRDGSKSLPAYLDLPMRPQDLRPR